MGLELQSLALEWLDKVYGLELVAAPGTEEMLAAEVALGVDTVWSDGDKSLALGSAARGSLGLALALALALDATTRSLGWLALVYWRP